MRPAPLLASLTATAAAYDALVRGALTLDLGIGRRTRPLGPIRVSFAAPRATVFEAIAAPYLGRTPRAMSSKLEVLERGGDMVLAAHHTVVGRRTTTTLETVRFEPPRRVSFRLVRGPVPHVVETYELSESAGGTELVYGGELGTDGWRVGSWWADRVASPWEQAVRASLEAVRLHVDRSGGPA